MSGLDRQLERVGDAGGRRGQACWGCRFGALGEIQDIVREGNSAGLKGVFGQCRGNSRQFPQRCLEEGIYLAAQAQPGLVEESRTQQNRPNQPTNDDADTNPTPNQAIRPTPLPKLLLHFHPDLHKPLNVPSPTQVLTRRRSSIRRIIARSHSLHSSRRLGSSFLPSQTTHKHTSGFNHLRRARPSPKLLQSFPHIFPIPDAQF